MEHFTEDLGNLYCCRRHKFAIKPFLANTAEGAVGGVGLWSLNCFDCGFAYLLGPGYFPLVSFVCCPVEVSVDHSSRGILPSVVCLSVITKPRK